MLYFRRTQSIGNIFCPGTHSQSWRQGANMKTHSLQETCQRIILAIAEAEEVPASDLPPLGNTIDVEALQTFLQSSSGSATTEFRYLGRRIRVKADGRMIISELDGEQCRYVTRCNTCGEEKRDVELETAQEFFTTHVDQSHAVEINRSGVEPHPSEDTFGSETGQAEGTD